MKLPHFPRPRLSSTVSPRPFMAVWGHVLLKIFKIRIFNLDENEFQTTQFPDFWNSVTNSMTFRGLLQIPLLFQVFQVSGNPEANNNCFHEHKIQTKRTSDGSRVASKPDTVKKGTYWQGT